MYVHNSAFFSLATSRSAAVPRRDGGVGRVILASADPRTSLVPCSIFEFQTRMPKKVFDQLTEPVVLALAISNEDDGRPTSPTTCARTF